ncbi:asparagine synthase-related protein [Streptomyces sp. NPDC052396]|uniref:asparagine synthase-related protein n=1 Tax=Streptomyces sp. NPDC052396 TaxID=3365689 RepID=UPI0037D10F3A
MCTSATTRHSRDCLSTHRSVTMPWPRQRSLPRPHEAASPWSYKPLLAAAMDGLVPEPILRRTTKDHCMPEWQEGLRLQRHTLAAWADDSRLVAAGVADEAELRRALLSPALLAGSVSELEMTLAAEAWLRDVEHQKTLNHSREMNDAPTAR